MTRDRFLHTIRTTNALLENTFEFEFFKSYCSVVQYGPSLRRRPLVLVSPRSIDKFQLRRKLIQAKSESYRIPTPSTTRVKQANESKYLLGCSIA